MFVLLASFTKLCHKFEIEILISINPEQKIKWEVCLKTSRNKNEIFLNGEQLNNPCLLRRKKAIFPILLHRCVLNILLNKALFKSGYTLTVSHVGGLSGRNVKPSSFIDWLYSENQFPRLPFI